MAQRLSRRSKGGPEPAPESLCCRCVVVVLPCNTYFPVSRVFLAGPEHLGAAPTWQPAPCTLSGEPLQEAPVKASRHNPVALTGIISGEIFKTGCKVTLLETVEVPMKTRELSFPRSVIFWGIDFSFLCVCMWGEPIAAPAWL